MLEFCESLHFNCNPHLYGIEKIFPQKASSLSECECDDETKQLVSYVVGQQRAHLEEICE
ncbi:hypothetical protein T06_526 [Trichinella sp. T6]|nr:hypothetical protein T06_526 [Trichinella sp. T6]